MKSPLYEARPARANETYDITQCAEDSPEKVGYTIVMIDPDAGTVTESGHLYGSLESAQYVARSMGTVVVHEHVHDDGQDVLIPRTVHFATPETIAEELEQVATDPDGFGTVHRFELFWGAGGQELRRQWRLDID